MRFRLARSRWRLAALSVVLLAAVLAACAPVPSGTYVWATVAFDGRFERGSVLRLQIDDITAGSTASSATIATTTDTVDPWLLGYVGDRAYPVRYDPSRVLPGHVYTVNATVSFPDTLGHSPYNGYPDTANGLSPNAPVNLSAGSNPQVRIVVAGRRWFGAE
jgi:hypothetical protein